MKHALSLSRLVPSCIWVHFNCGCFTKCEAPMGTMETYIQTERAIQIDLGLGDRDSMLIRGFQGTEAVSRLYEYRLDLQFQGKTMRFDEGMGKKATVTLEI